MNLTSKQIKHILSGLRMLRGVNESIAKSWKQIRQKDNLPVSKREIEIHNDLLELTISLVFWRMP